MKDYIKLYPKEYKRFITQSNSVGKKDICNIDNSYFVYKENKKGKRRLSYANYVHECFVIYLLYYCIIKPSEIKRKLFV